MLARFRDRIWRMDSSNLNVVAFFVAFAGSWALAAALWQLVLSLQMHLAPMCGPDDTVRNSCTYTGAATVDSINAPWTVTINGTGFIASTAELPFGADVSFLHPGDRVTATEWHGQIASITEHGHTLAALGSPDHGPLAWPGVLTFAAAAGASAYGLWQLGKRTRVTLSRSLWT